MKPVNMNVPNFGGHKNNALNELINVSANPVHEAHLRKAEELKAPKTKFNPPNQSPMVGNPWLAMQRGSK